MNILCIDPTSDPLWQRLVDRDESSVFHSPEWIRVLRETYGFEICAHVVVDRIDEPRAGIPSCRILDFLGDRVNALPFSDFCDPLVDDRDQWNSLVDKLLKEGSTVTVRCLHNTLPLADPRFSLVKQAGWHRLHLAPGLDAIWNGLHSSARRAIRKAERDGVVIELTREEKALRAFFEMHVKVRKYKYRLLAQPYRMFENIWRHFMEREKGFVMVAAHHGEIIGGILFLEWRDTLYYKFNASSLSELSQRPNDLLMWESIKYAKEKGYNYLDFGLSDWDQEGLVRYKRKYATEEKTISYLRCAPNGTPIEGEKQVRSVLTQVTGLFTDESVPDSVTEKAGDILYRYFA